MPKAHIVAGPLALVATVATVGIGVVASDADPRDLIAASNGATSISMDAGEDRQVVSRSSSRRDVVNLQRAFDISMTRTATLRAVRQADTRLWTTAPLNLWTGPTKGATKVGLAKSSTRILITGRRTAERTEVVWGGKSRWVTQGHLAENQPVAETETDTDSADTESSSSAAPALGGACTNGSSVSGGANVLAVHEAVCAAFPEITSYGTYRGDGEHAQGLAIDIMVSGDRGWQVAEFVRSHYSELGVSYAIYSQNIWSVDRSAEGWRGLEDRGSTTANHYDHVHVTTY